jgi:hypothetical protein
MDGTQCPAHPGIEKVARDQYTEKDKRPDEVKVFEIIIK